MLPRLKTAEQFAAVLDASKHKAAQPAGMWRSAHFALHMAPLSAAETAVKPESKTASPGRRPSASATPIIGVICPKRWAKRAVTRNTIKRQIYAVFSELEPQLPAACLVLRLASGFSREQFPSATSSALKATLRAELLALLGKLPAQQGAAV
nr:ribonuclease P protein component [Variovorax sp. PCZ-1]